MKAVVNYNYDDKLFFLVNVMCMSYKLGMFCIVK